MKKTKDEIKKLIKVLESMIKDYPLVTFQIEENYSETESAVPYLISIRKILSNLPEMRKK